MRLLLPAFVLGSWCAVAAQAPQVVSLEPPNGSEVEAAKTTKLVATFDRPMNQGGFSFCGGGPAFPKGKGRPQWIDDRTVVLEVELEPDHAYSLSLNCPAATNFRSKDGTALAPVPWSFVTTPEKLLPAGKQKSRNKKALAALMKTLAERYSYYDLRVDDWKKLEKEHSPAILAARTDRGFAMAAAAMLKPTEDIHLYLKCGDQTYATGTRAVDPLFRRELLDSYVRTAPAGPQALAGRTADGIGYLMVGTWTGDVDTKVIDGAITELGDTKAMVIDARPNCGGDETLAREVAAWFVRGTKTYAKDRHRERAGDNGFSAVFERQITGHGDNRYYDKPIAVLTSRYVMSSNESFVMMLQQAEDCVVVGQPTFGSSGNPKPFELGNDVTVFVPSWQDMKLDGSMFEGEGLQPDEFVPCTPDDLKSRDPILERGLELLREKVRAAK
jgi:hypothetical protein